MIVALDIDGVICDPHSELLRRYNHDWDDNLTYEDIEAWGISAFVKPECGSKIMDYFANPTLYNYAPVIGNALEVVRQLQDANHRVIYVTDPYPGTEGRKLRWLVDHGFLFSLQKGRRDYVETADKSLVRADVLVDDKPANLNSFHGKGYLFDQPWNRSDESLVRIRRLEELLSGLIHKNLDFDTLQRLNEANGNMRFVWKKGGKVVHQLEIDPLTALEHRYCSACFKWRGELIPTRVYLSDWLHCPVCGGVSTLADDLICTCGQIPHRPLCPMNPYRIYRG